MLTYQPYARLQKFNVAKLPILLLLLVLATPWAQAVYFCVDYSLHPDLNFLRAHQLAIISPEADLDVKALKDSGTEVYAYLSVIEVAKDAWYRAEVAKRRIPILSTNQSWASLLADVREASWRDFVVTNLAARAAQKPFAGFFLDTADSVDLLTEKFPEETEAFRAGLIQLVKDLKRKFPDKKLVMNRGFSVWERLRRELSGVLIESLYQTYDDNAQKYAPVVATDTSALLQILHRVKAAGLEVYVIDYVDPAQSELAATTAGRIQKAGFHAFISTPALDGIGLGPVRTAPRFLLALFGNREADAASAIRWPADSFIAQAVQMPLEWLGYELDYLNLTSESLPERLGPHYAGVLLDRYLDIPSARQDEVARWLIQQKQAGKKIIILGVLPFEDESLAALTGALGITGSGDELGSVRGLEAAMSPSMNFEAKVPLTAAKFIDIAAPPGSRLHLSLSATDTANRQRRCDPVFTCSWGGMLLDPYAFFTRPDFDEHWLVNPFDFLAEALSRPDWPAPDPTTRDGMRIFYTHIDGDGFRHESSVEPGRRSSEVLLQRVVKKYPFPFTCSIIEAEIRGFVVNQPAGDAARLTRLAREMFALPKVEAGSHSYSHPFFWSEDDQTASLYNAQNLDLVPEHNPAKLDLRQEVTGSVKFIQEKLLPPGKKVEIFLWSGNCRPGPEALRLTRELGIENMNGGDTIISRKNPSVSKVAPHSMPWGGELQINSSHQNENVYRERWQPEEGADGPFFGGFIHARDGFERMENPRRLKPVNIYFHWYSGDNLASLKALSVLFDWAQEQELHALTAAQFARIVRDLHRTRLFQVTDKPGSWIAVNEGQLRTFRFSARGGFPDLTASKGVTGYRIVRDVMYVHTDGSRRIELALRPQPSPGVYLVASSAEINFAKLERSRAAFSVADVRPCQVTLAGFPAQGTVNVTVNDVPSTLKADKEGQLKLSLPDKARVVAAIL